MKKLSTAIFLLLISGIFVLFPSCKEEEPPILTIQERLETETPLELFNSGVPLEDLYGKIYEKGLIFYLNTSDGTGLVAKGSDQGDVIWGCPGTDIQSLPNVPDYPGSPEDPETETGARIGDGKTNTDAFLAECTEAGIAARLCRDLGPEWFLPSRGELELMWTNLGIEGLGNFAEDWYWSSTEADSAQVWVQVLGNGGSGGSRILWSKAIKIKARAIRAF